MMNQEIKQKWVAALRSGEYKQGRKFLRIENSFCCLGVLCDLHSKENDEGKWSDGGGYSGRSDERGSHIALPRSVEDWSETNTCSPYVLYSNTNTSIPPVPFSNGKAYLLSQLNDDGLSFNEIADLIEKQL